MEQTTQTTTTEKKADHFLVAGGAGYWGKGKTVPEAVKNARWLKPGDKVEVAKVDADAYVDQLGRLYADVYEPVFEGTVSGAKRSLK